MKLCVNLFIYSLSFGCFIQASLHCTVTNLKNRSWDGTWERNLRKGLHIYIYSRKKMVTENTNLDFIHVGHHNYLVIPQAKIIESLGKKKLGIYIWYLNLLIKQIIIFFWHLFFPFAAFSTTQCHPHFIFWVGLVK